MKKVVITGIGVVTPCGIGKDEFWRKSISGKSYTTPYTEFLEYNLKSRVVGKIADIDLSLYNISEEEKENSGNHILYGLIGSGLAIADSRLDLNTIDKNRAGVCLGNAIADTPKAESQYLAIKDALDDNSKYDTSKHKVEKELFFKSMFSCISTALSAKYKFNGPSFTMTTGCTSGIDAAGYAFETIQNGDADVFITGATEAPLTCMTLASFDVIGATSIKNSPPHMASSPFDSSRDGFVLAEGSGILIFEELEHALKRGAHIYCEVKSFSTNNNAWHMTDLPEDGAPLAATIRQAIDFAGINNNEIDYINAHGSSTPQNDVFETNAYKNVFGSLVYQIPISSTKSIIGHPLGAASAIELVHCCLAIENNKIPPTVNLFNPDPKCDLDYVPNKSRDKQINVVLTDASGFSGIHSAMILKKY